MLTKCIIKSFSPILKPCKFEGVTAISKTNMLLLDWSTSSLLYLTNFFVSIARVSKMKLAARATLQIWNYALRTLQFSSASIFLV